MGVTGNKARRSVGRDVLFIERNLDFLKPGGRMAIVLPQGRFNNTSDNNIRRFIAERARILAVVGLHQNTFKPHTGTKTSVLFLQKWNDDPAQGPLCPRVEDYPIFMAVSEKGGKDNSGNYVYVKDENGEYQLDKNGHLVVDHDLHNHDGQLREGIAEAFIEWAGQQGLSFWPEEEAEAETRRHAWQSFLWECRRNPVPLDPEVDINALIDELYDPTPRKIKCNHRNGRLAGGYGLVVYFDTDLLVNAFFLQDAGKNQQATEILERHFRENNVLISPLSVQELLYVLNRRRVGAEKIHFAFERTMQFQLVTYGPAELQRAYDLATTIGFQNINDCIHTAIAESHCTELITYNRRDFIRIQRIARVGITIL